MASNHRVASD